MQLVSDMLQPLVCRSIPFIPIIGWATCPFIGLIRPSVVGDRQRAGFTNGFTLVELLITLLVAGILLGLVVPSMRDFLLSNRLVATTNVMLADLKLTRSEAIKRGTQAVMCASIDGSTCSGGPDWNLGWMVYADANNDGAWTAGTDVRLRIQESFSDDIFIASGLGQDRVVFTRQGLLFRDSGGTYLGKDTYTVCNLELNEARIVEVELTGRSSWTKEQSCF